MSLTVLVMLRIPSVVMVLWSVSSPTQLSWKLIFRCHELVQVFTYVRESDSERFVIDMSWCYSVSPHL
jgi:hypothetical protein